MFILSENRSIADNILVKLRDIHSQRDPEIFRMNMRKLGLILAYELSKSLEYKDFEINTPLEQTTSPRCISKITLVCMLRASLPFFEGFLELFPDAENAFIGVQRVEDGSGLEIDLSYLASPSIEGKTVIICDPMLATGQSILNTLSQLEKFGNAKSIHIAAGFAAPEGIENLKNNINGHFNLWIGSLERELNENHYILPGLGDAGDLAFGPKL